MTATTAADRLDDTFPHGTPAGYRKGCRGTGGCPNNGTDRMTCREASTRYARDLPYRRAIDAGQLLLSREPTPEAAVRQARTQIVARARDAVPRTERPQRRVAQPGPVEIPTPTPTQTPRTAPPVQPAPAPAETRPAPSNAEAYEKPARPREKGWKHGVYGYQVKGCRCAVCVEANNGKQRTARTRRRELASNAEAASQRLLLDAETARRKAEETVARQQHELEELRVSNSRLLADLDTLTLAPAPAAPQPAPLRPTVHAGRTPDGGIQLRLSGVEAIAVIEPETLRLLAEHFRDAS